MNNGDRDVHMIHVIDVYRNQKLVNVTDKFFRLVTSRFNMTIPIVVHTNAMMHEGIQFHGDNTIVELVNMMPNVFLPLTRLRYKSTLAWSGKRWLRLTLIGGYLIYKYQFVDL